MASSLPQWVLDDSRAPRCAWFAALMLGAQSLGSPVKSLFEHPRLAWRGAAPHPPRHLAGDMETGVTISMQMDAGLDTVTCCCAWRAPILTPTRPPPHDKVADLGSEPDRAGVERGVALKAHGAAAVRRYLRALDEKHEAAIDWNQDASNHSAECAPSTGSWRQRPAARETIKGLVRPGSPGSCRTSGQIVAWPPNTLIFAVINSIVRLTEPQRSWR